MVDYFYFHFHSLSFSLARHRVLFSSGLFHAQILRVALDKHKNKSNYDISAIHFHAKLQVPAVAQTLSRECS